MSSEQKITDNIGELSFDLLFAEEPHDFSSTKEEKPQKIENVEKIDKIDKIDKKTLFFNRFKEKELSKNQNSR